VALGRRPLLFPAVEIFAIKGFRNFARQGGGGKGAENKCNLFFYVGSKKCSSRRTESQVKEFGGGGGS
jgi:hypothetical protein